MAMDGVPNSQELQLSPPSLKTTISEQDEATAKRRRENTGTHVYMYAQMHVNAYIHKHMCIYVRPSLHCVPMHPLSCS